jgi:hypothetical protein
MIAQVSVFLPARAHIAVGTCRATMSDRGTRDETAARSVPPRRLPPPVNRMEQVYICCLVTTYLVDDEPSEVEYTITATLCDL